MLVRIGDQEDRVFLRELVAEFGSLNIVLDDGGYTAPRQSATFEEVFPAVRPDGLYMVEDLLTSYRPNYNGGLRKPGTFIEYAKGLIDQLHAWHSHERGFEPGPFMRSDHGLHFYDSILVIEKHPITPPRHDKRGQPSF